MAVQSNNSNTPFIPADAFLHVTVVDIENNEFEIFKGIPLHVTNALYANLIDAAKDNPDLVLNLTGKIRIVVPKEHKVPKF